MNKKELQSRETIQDDPRRRERLSAAKLWALDA